MIGLIRAETIKLVKRKLLWAMLAVLAALMGVVAFFILIFPTIAPEQFGGQSSIVAKPDAYLFGAAQALSQTWFPLVLAVVFLGGETSTSIWPTSLTMESRRWLHLLAKITVLTVAASVGTLLATGLWTIAAAFFAEGSGAPGLGVWLGLVWKVALTEFMWVSLGLGLVALLRSVGPAIGVGLAFSFGEGLLSLWEPYREVSLGMASQRIVGDFANVGGGVGEMFGTMSFAQAVFVIIGWSVVGMAMAVSGLQYRDP